MFCYVKIGAIAGRSGFGRHWYIELSYSIAMPSYLSSNADYGRVAQPQVGESRVYWVLRPSLVVIMARSRRRARPSSRNSTSRLATSR